MYAILRVVKLLILYRPNSEHATTVESFIRDFQRQHELAAENIEILSLDTREGAEKAEIYDIVSYPAIMALSDDGSILNAWMGEPLPLMTEVAGYTFTQR